MKTPSPTQLLSLAGLAVLLTITGCSPPAMFENEYGTVFSAIDSNAAIPSGMRRTTQGWEDSSLWTISTDLETRSIETWIKRQRQHEPSWVRRSCERIRTTPPLMIAVLQISAIAAIVRISRSQKPEHGR